jgi:hypothetical protein
MHRQLMWYTFRACFGRQIDDGDDGVDDVYGHTRT